MVEVVDNGIDKTEEKMREREEWLKIYSWRKQKNEEEWRKPESLWKLWDSIPRANIHYENSEGTENAEEVERLFKEALSENFKAQEGYQYPGIGRSASQMSTPK